MSSLNDAALTALEEITHRIRTELKDGNTGTAALLVRNQYSALQALDLQNLTTEDKQRLQEIADQVVRQQSVLETAASLTDLSIKALMSRQHYSVSI